MLSTDKRTDRQTDKLTNATKNITSFAKEVITTIEVSCAGYDSKLSQGVFFKREFLIR